MKDMSCGFRAMKTTAFKKMMKNAKGDFQGYNWETDMNAYLLQNNIKYAEVEIPTIYLNNHKGTTIFDGVKIFFRLIELKLYYLCDEWFHNKKSSRSKTIKYLNKIIGVHKR